MAIAGYAGPSAIRTILGVWEISKMYFWIALWTFLGALILTSFMVCFNIWGAGMILNSAIGLVAIVVCIVLRYTPALVILQWVFSAVRAQPGNTPGFSLADAMTGIGEDAEKIKKVLLAVLFYITIAAAFLAFIPLKNSPSSIVPILFFVLVYFLACWYWGIPSKWAKLLIMPMLFLAVAVSLASLVPDSFWHRVGIANPIALSENLESDKLAAQFRAAQKATEEGYRKKLIASALKKERDKLACDSATAAEKASRKLACEAITDKEQAAIEDRTIPAAALSAKSSIEEAISGLRYKKTLYIEVKDLGEKVLCGVRPGRREFEVQEHVSVKIDGLNYGIWSNVRIDRTFPKESFVVGKDGCVKVSFAFPADFLKKGIEPQVIPITFM